MSQPPPLAVRMASITKRYPRVLANDHASLEVRRGEVHAVVGENGAGKSTLVQILYGLIPADDGEIEIAGRRLWRHSPKAAIEAGLGMVFQHFKLVPSLTVAENVVLGIEPRRRGILFDQRAAAERVRKIALELALPIDPDLAVERCSVGLQQRVEILKALARGAEIIILDEPTAVLTPQEVDDLILVVRRLAAQGKAVILITHKLREVMAAADRVTVMRRGRTLETVETQSTNAGAIAEKMIGRALQPPPRSSIAAASDRPVLEVEGLSASGGPGARALMDVRLSVRAGEIVGIAGIDGNGQSELVNCIVGLAPADAGSIRLLGQDLGPLDVRARSELGIAHVPEDRLRRALVLDFTLEENAILGLAHRPEFSSHGSLRFDRIRAHAERIIHETDVRPAEPSLRSRDLSGGNQQKLVLGRELSRRPRLLIACHPTRGLDVGAAEQVHRALLAERDRGAAVLFVSAELPELLALSDRLLVMVQGRVAGEVDPQKTDERQLGLLMAGQTA